MPKVSKNAEVALSAARDIAQTEYEDAAVRIQAVKILMDHDAEVLRHSEAAAQRHSKIAALEQELQTARERIAQLETDARQIKG